MTSKKETTNQDSVTPPELRNPDGKGGFGDNPQNRSNGRWSKEGSISYNYNKLMRMSVEEVDEFVPTTMAEKIAKARVQESVKSLNDAKEITDRTEGKAPQFIGLGGQEEYDQMLVQFIGTEEVEL